MTTSPQVAGLDRQIDKITRLAEAQTLVVTNLIKNDGDTRDAEHTLWTLMDLLSGLREQRFELGDVGEANARAFLTRSSWAQG